MKRFSPPSERLLRAFFLGLAAIHFGLGVWMFAAPHSFFVTIGAFDSYNRHYERDTATFYLAFAVGSWIAASRPGWRVPVLAITTVQYAIHTVNHAIDVGAANNSWAGPVDLISLGLATVQFAVLLRVITSRTRSEDRT